MKKGKQAGAVLLSCALLAGCVCGLGGCARGNGENTSGESRTAQSEQEESGQRNKAVDVASLPYGFRTQGREMIGRINALVPYPGPYLSYDQVDQDGYLYSLPYTDAHTSFMFDDDNSDGNLDLYMLFVIDDPSGENKDFFFDYAVSIMQAIDPTFNDPGNPLRTHGVLKDGEKTIEDGEYTYHGITYRISTDESRLETRGVLGRRLLAFATEAGCYSVWNTWFKWHPEMGDDLYW